MLSTILIIDKRKELSTKYKKSISTSETHVLVAGTLKDALIMVQNLEPDLIIISDSIEENLDSFCQKIRALTYNSRPVILALSKSAEIEDRIKVLESGADDFISEPVNIDEFKSRIKAHLRRDIESNLDTKTLLPNQKYVKKALKRILSSETDSVLIIGFENLENYTSAYTEVASDKLIQTFVAIAKSALSQDDFIGRYDEKNFIIVTNKYNSEKLAAFLSFAFDTVAPKFYSEADAKRGYMLLKSDRYAGMRANFVSILIGGILDNFNLIPSVDILINRLLEVKKMARIPYGSNFAFERTKLTASDSIINKVFDKSIYIKESDDSLKFLLRTSLELQGYEVQETLSIDSGSQPSLLIIDIDNNFSNLDYLKEIKRLQSFANSKIIATTTIHDKAKILDSGADLYLPKPYEISDLIRWVEYFIKEQL